MAIRKAVVPLAPYLVWCRHCLFVRGRAGRRTKSAPTVVANSADRGLRLVVRSPRAPPVCTAHCISHHAGGILVEQIAGVPMADRRDQIRSATEQQQGRIHNLLIRALMLPGPGTSKMDLAILSWIASALLAVALMVGFTVLVYAAFTIPSRNGGLTVVMFSLAAGMSGSLLGFLFGLPRVTRGSRSRSQSRFNASTNLEDVSDWLTKIIVGLGLVEFRRVAASVERLARWIADRSGDPFFEPFILAALMYFAVIGFLIGYLWSRLSFWQIMNLVDRIFDDASPEMGEAVD